MRISDWSSDVCSSDLAVAAPAQLAPLRSDPGTKLVPAGSGSAMAIPVAVPLPLLVTRMQYRILAPGIALALVVPLTGSLTMPLVFAIARFVVGRQKMMSWSAMPCCPGLAGARAWLPYSHVKPSTGAVQGRGAGPSGLPSGDCKT